MGCHLSPSSVGNGSINGSQVNSAGNRAFLRGEERSTTLGGGEGPAHQPAERTSRQVFFLSSQPFGQRSLSRGSLRKAPTTRRGKANQNRIEIIECTGRPAKTRDPAIFPSSFRRTTIPPGEKFICEGVLFDCQRVILFER